MRRRFWTEYKENAGAWATPAFPLIGGRTMQDQEEPDNERQKGARNGFAPLSRFAVPASETRFV